MDLAGRSALVTGANRGLGAHLVQQLLDAGTSRVYAGARRPGTVASAVREDSRVTVLTLDVTDEDSVRAAAEAAADISVLVNNAGTLRFGSALEVPLADTHADLEVNLFGTLRTTRAFLPALEAQPAAAVVNVLTLIALAPVPAMAGYCLSKAAAHSATQALRSELRPRGVRVLGAYPGGIDTEMLAGVEADKADPSEVARRIVAALEADQEVVFPDDASAGAGAVYATDPWKLEQLLAG